MKKNTMTCMLALLAGVAQATVLTFDAGVGDNDLMPQDYGDNVTATNMGSYAYEESGEGFTPNVTVEYIGDPGGLHYWGPGFSGTTGILNNEDADENFTTAKFTAATGHQVALHSLLWSSYSGQNFTVDAITVTDQDSTVLYNSGSFLTGGSHATINLGAITGQTLTVTADLTTSGSDNDSFGFDNIVFSEMELPTAPVITAQPASVYTDEGDLAIFSVVATASSGTLSYAWTKDSAPLTDNEFIAGSAHSRLVISPAALADAGNYQVIVSDAQDSTPSSVAALTLTLPLPSISSEPVDSTVASGANASFSVTASDVVSYQWYKGEIALVAETGTSLQLTGVTQNDNGVYSVRISNARGSIETRAARLTVTQTSSIGEAIDNNQVLIDNAGSWSAQSAITSDGSDAARSASITHGQSSQLNTTLVGPGDYSFNWAVSSEEGFDSLFWYMDGITKAGISGSPAWAGKSDFVPDNSHTVTWTYAKDGSTSEAQDAGFVDQFTFTPYGLSSVEEAIDSPPPTPLVFGGPARWYGQDNTTHDGTDAARSPKIGDGESSWFETTIQGPGKVVFWSKTSSESGFDYLRFRVDGTTAFFQSGLSGWVATTNWIDWGTHTLRWSYEKEGSGSHNEDTAWVDQVSYTPVDRSSLAEAADGNGLIWTTSESNPWFGQNHFTDDGIDALQSGITGHGGASWAKAVTTGSGTFNFRWKISCEDGFDYLRFYVNDVLQSSRSGNGGWVDYSIELTGTGPKELMWKYTKDGSGSHFEDAGFIDQVGFDIPTASLTVASEFGTPSPAVGVHTYNRDSIVSCSVAHVNAGTVQYECIGWTGTGSVPSSGNANSIEVTLTEDSTITWNWATNYLLDVNISGNGSVDADDAFYVAGSQQTLTATPDTGWIFMGWSGDASGTNTTSVTMDAPKTVMANFSDDADDDGLTNTEEAGYGSNPWKKDTDDDGFDDAFEVTQGLPPTLNNSAITDYIGNNGSTFDLYPSNVVLDVAVGQMLIETMGGTATLSLQLEESGDLINWTNAGPAEVWSWPVDGDKKFFRIRSRQ